MRTYSTYAEAVQAEIIDPIQAGLPHDQDAREQFDIDALSDDLIAWLPGNGYRLRLDDDDDSAAEFWAVAQKFEK